MQPMSEKKKVFYYITDEYSRTVRDSQVTEWLVITDKHNIHFNLVIITSIKYIFFNNSFRREKIRNIKKTIKGKIFQIPVIKRNDPTGFSTASTTLILFFMFLKHLFQGKKIVIQTRVLHMAKTLSFLKKVYPHIKIIFDNRGASADEYINALGLRSTSETKNHQIRRKYNNLINKLKKFVEISDVIFTVSNKLSKYVVEKSNLQALPEMQVIPGAADETKFYFDKNIRNKYRHTLNFNDNVKLYIFTGSLESHWHMKDFMFHLMSILVARSNNNHFMCITPDIKTAQNLQERFQIPKNSITIKYLQHHDINSYLNAADFGLLLRENVVTNNVASPTKFSEYLLSGLPVIISTNVGDFSDYVKANRCGLCINNDLDVLPYRLENLRICDNTERYSIAEKARNSFSKQRLIQERINIYNSM